MKVLRKVKEVGFSILPVFLLVALLHWFVTPLKEGMLLSFLIGGVLIILGLSLFLLGTDIGLIPIGEKIGSTVTRKKRISLVLFTALVVGVAIIFAEPNISILAGQVFLVAPSISPLLMTFSIALGVGIFLMIAMVRVVLHIPLKWVYAISYVLLFVLGSFSNLEFLGIAFDSGGAATGPLAVPFIMALGVGIARVQKNQSDADNFGYVSLVLIGPTMAMLLLSLFQGENQTATHSSQAVPQMQSFLSLIVPSTLQVLSSLLPLILVCIFFQIFLVRMPARQLIRMSFGLFYASLGLILFFVGVNGGFIPVGYQIGYQLGRLNTNFLLVAGLLIGSLTVLSEPSVAILINQVQEITQGHLRKPVMLGALAIGVGGSGLLAMVRIIYSLPILYFLMPVYGLAIFLSFRVPDLFIGLSFDSGSVSSGPLASTFLLSFAIGASVAVGGNPVSDAFGIIIFVSMTPVVIVQLLGLLYKRKQAKLQKGGRKQ
ncbi:MAG: DUF1538 domain-containing protein [Sphaerochaetaceae bacterium]